MFSKGKMRIKKKDEHDLASIGNYTAKIKVWESVEDNTPQEPDQLEVKIHPTINLLKRNRLT